MTYVSDMVDQLRLLLNDPTDTQVAFTTKKLYLNRGIARLWPKIYRVVNDVTKVTPDASVTTDITLPALMSAGHLISVEVETSAGSGFYMRWDDYDIIPGDEDQTAVLKLANIAPETGSSIRIRYAAPVTQIGSASYVAAQAEEWVGPDEVIGLPVLYAMGMIAASKLDDRQDTTRYSTTQALNGVTDQDIMGSSQMWFGMFEDELGQYERPLPIARD